MYEIVIQTEIYLSCTYKQIFIFEQDTIFYNYLKFQPITLKIGQMIMFYNHSKKYMISSEFKKEKISQYGNSLETQIFAIDQYLKRVCLIIEPLNETEYKLLDILFQ